MFFLDGKTHTTERPIESTLILPCFQGDLIFPSLISLTPTDKFWVKDENVVLVKILESDFLAFVSFFVYFPLFFSAVDYMSLYVSLYVSMLASYFGGKA